MKKILLLEDIIEKAKEIQLVLKDYDFKMLHSCQSFANHIRFDKLLNFIKETDIFLLDFNLGDGTILNTNIYKYILDNKKNDSVLCCISSYSECLIESWCGSVSKSFNRLKSFDFYLQKDAEDIVFFVKNFLNQPDKLMK